MPELNLTVLSGLPGSGKSTEARRLAAETAAMVVDRDSYRKWFAVVDESELTLLLVQLSASFLRNGLSVIVDSWNLHPADRVRWTELAHLAGATLVWKHMGTPVEECVKRDSRRPSPNGAAAVRQAAAQYAAQLRVLAIGLQ